MPDPNREPDPAPGRATRPGRPRDPQADRAIIAATLELISESGYEGFRVDDVAERAGVSKTTLYRRWATKCDLVLAALWDAPPLAPVDTGRLDSDLVQLMLQFLRITESIPLIELLASLAAERQRAPRLSQSIDPYVAERMRPVAHAFQRAVARGEIAPHADVELAAAMLGGAIVMRLLFGGATDRATIDRLVVMVASSIGYPQGEPRPAAGARQERT